MMSVNTLYWVRGEGIESEDKLAASACWLKQCKLTYEPVVSSKQSAARYFQLDGLKKRTWLPWK